MKTGMDITFSLVVYVNDVLLQLQLLLLHVLIIVLLLLLLLCIWQNLWNDRQNRKRLLFGEPSSMFPVLHFISKINPILVIIIKVGPFDMICEYQTTYFLMFGKIRKIVQKHHPTNVLFFLIWRMMMSTPSTKENVLKENKHTI